MWKHERTQPRLLDIIGIRTGAPTLTIYCLSSSEVRHSPLPLPVSVSCGLGTLGTSDLTRLRIDSAGKLGQWILLLGRMLVRLLLKFPWN